MRLFQFVRIVVLCGFIGVLWTRPQPVRAQYSNFCYTYETDEGCCGLNCSTSCVQDAIVVSTGSGTQTFQPEELTCKPCSGLYGLQFAGSLGEACG